MKYAGWIVRASQTRSGFGKNIFLVAIDDADKALAAVQEFVGRQFAVELGSPVEDTHLASRGIRTGEIRVLGTRAKRKLPAGDDAAPRS